MLCDQVLSSSPIQKDYLGDDLNDSYLENLMKEDDEVATEDDNILNPDQDHDYLLNKGDVTDRTLLKVKVLSLETELRRKKNERKCLEDELLETKLSLAAKSEEVLRLKHEVENKQDAAEVALARMNLLEEKKFKIL